jgi:large subunit ribosomal protein L25
MSQTSVLPAKRRTEVGSKAVGKLREQGLVPAILYGHKETPVNLAVDHEPLDALVKAGAHGLLDLNIDGTHESAIIKELQWDVYGKAILHADFVRVSKGERIRVEVNIVLKGTAAGVNEGGVVDQPIHDIELECPADNILDSVVLNVQDLHLGKSLFVKDLPLPAGVKALADPDLVVVHVVKKAKAEETPVAAAGTAEPEVIKREAKPDKEEE